MRKTFILFLIVLPLFFSCKRLELYKKNIRLIKVSELSSAKVSDSAVVALLAKEMGVRSDICYTLSEDTALRYLREKKVDLAIIPNNISCQDASLRTVAPMLPRILVILAMNIDRNETHDLAKLFREHNIIYEDLSRVDSIFFQTFFSSIGVRFDEIKGQKVNSLNLEQWRDSTLVFAGLTHMHNSVMKELIGEGAYFISLDDASLLGHGSTVDGVVLNYPPAMPFILPKAYYKGKPSEPVLTVAIPDILITRKDESDAFIYDLVKALVENKKRLVDMDNIYNLLQTHKFTSEAFTFPLHDGAVSYLNRDEPSLLTRYAAVIWPFISIIAILAGAFASVKRRMRLRKKLSIESFYRRLLSLRKRAIRAGDEKKRDQLINELRKLRSEAFDALMNDQLIADDSFQIFLILYSEVFNEIAA
jgi:hypothetical protein